MRQLPWHPAAHDWEAHVSRTEEEHMARLARKRWLERGTVVNSNRGGVLLDGRRRWYNWAEQPDSAPWVPKRGERVRCTVDRWDNLHAVAVEPPPEPDGPEIPF